VHPVIQIYTMQTVDEALAVAAAGVERIGVTPARRDLPGEVTIEMGVDIVAALKGVAVSSAISVETDLDDIEAMVRRVQPDVLHLCGPPGGVTPDDVVELRRRLPSIEIMQAIAVGTDDAAIEDAVDYAAVADSIILDSVTPDIAGIGAAGVTHDWSISRRIVDAVDIPVILAGGLSAENVAESIREVGPWAVDSLTHTNRPSPGGGFRKDLGKVVAFAAAARAAV
jgi:phosphoribosylanthranilate isomerase